MEWPLFRSAAKEVYDHETAAANAGYNKAILRTLSHTI